MTDAREPQPDDLLTARQIADQYGIAQGTVESLDLATDWLRKWRENYDRVEHGSDVYFVQHETGGLIKIGESTNVHLRLAGLNANTHDPRYVLLATIPGGGRFYEGIFHHVFEDLRMHNEWFRAEQPLLDFIERVKEATTDA